MIRIILAEDHPVVRDGIKSILEAGGDIQVVGEAENGLEVIQLLKNNVQADLILTDINMPEMDGMTLLKTLAKDYPGMKVLFLSMMDNEKYLFDAFEIGAVGYILKSANVDELLFSIRQVYNGHKVICNELSLKLLHLSSNFAKVIQPSILLTEREQEILALISEGYTNQQIADRIFASRRTIEGHRQTLIERAGVKNSAQLVRYACKNGLL
ncbi:response regulator transcription factor [Pedobacter namyangjuensis]|uniref:response regulator transcription factor n=1 Tax=Pedobacter namyangjuensis TaxID=600626 RepID=UPI000DE391C5|nr:response regulator transcription factor [Pedobacter namyangjuensis]